MTRKEEMRADSKEITLEQLSDCQEMNFCLDSSEMNFCLDSSDSEMEEISFQATRKEFLSTQERKAEKERKERERKTRIYNRNQLQKRDTRDTAIDTRDTAIDTMTDATRDTTTTTTDTLDLDLINTTTTDTLDLDLINELKRELAQAKSKPSTPMIASTIPQGTKIKKFKKPKGVKKVGQFMVVSTGSALAAARMSKETRDKLLDFKNCRFNRIARSNGNPFTYINC